VRLIDGFQLIHNAVGEVLAHLLRQGLVVCAGELKVVPLGVDAPGVDAPGMSTGRDLSEWLAVPR
jgi:hypothetical protein